MLLYNTTTSKQGLATGWHACRCGVPAGWLLWIPPLKWNWRPLCTYLNEGIFPSLIILQLFILLSLNSVVAITHLHLRQCSQTKRTWFSHLHSQKRKSQVKEVDKNKANGITLSEHTKVSKGHLPPDYYYLDSWITRIPRAGLLSQLWLQRWVLRLLLFGIWVLVPCPESVSIFTNV